jgi:hypothetical protein
LTLFNDAGEPQEFNTVSGSGLCVDEELAGTAFSALRLCKVSDDSFTEICVP